MLLPLAIACCGCAAIPAVLTVLNLREYQPPPAEKRSGQPNIAVCIPARNEESGILACMASVLRSELVRVELWVVDDHSSDRTAEIVRTLAAADARVHLLSAPPLPPGWNGKQHACWIAAQHVAQQGPGGSAAPPKQEQGGGDAAPQTTTPDLLCFLDADVRLQPAALTRMASLLHRDNAALASGFPWEETGTTLEWLLIPLIHFVLLGYLPLALLRRTKLSGFAAGCGQSLMVSTPAYVASGGHAAIRETMHDGLLLPRLLRSSGYSTRLADLTNLASCRMYHSAAATWRGLAKNATEGLAAPGAILPFTLLLGLGAVLPVPLLLVTVARASTQQPATLLWAWAAVVLCYLPRLLEMRRFHQRPVSTVLHPVGVALLLTLQWYAFLRKLFGRPAAWKDRAYPAQ